MPRREFPAQPLAGVGAIVVWRDQVLLVQRARPPHLGLWSVPGGLIELGETAAQAARREVREETGLEVAIGSLVTVVDRIETAPDGRVRYHFVIADYLARPLDAAPSPCAASDAGAVRWCAWDEIASLPLTPGLAPVLARAREAIAAGTV